MTFVKSVPGSSNGGVGYGLLGAHVCRTTHSGASWGSYQLCLEDHMCGLGQWFCQTSVIRVNVDVQGRGSGMSNQDHTSCGRHTGCGFIWSESEASRDLCGGIEGKSKVLGVGYEYCR